MNTLSIIILVVVIAIIGGLALLYVKKGGAKGAVDWLGTRFNVILEMFTQPLFLVAAGSLAMAIYTGNQAQAIFTAIGFIGLKAVMTSSITIRDGFYQYDWTGNRLIDKFLCWTLSTKFVILVVTGIFLYFSGNAEGIKEIAAAFASAIGFNNVTKVITEANINKFMPKKTPQIEAEQPLPTPPVSLPSQPGNDVFIEIPVKQRTPFDADIMKAKARGYAERNIVETLKENENLAILKSVDTPGVAADSEICNNVDAAEDFLAWYKNLANEAFKEEMGFDFWDIEKHFNDLKVFKCPVPAGTDVEDIATYFGSAFKVVFADLIIIIRHIDQAFAEIARIGEGRVDAILQANNWSYMNMMQDLKFVK